MTMKSYVSVFTGHEPHTDVSFNEPHVSFYERARRCRCLAEKKLYGMKMAGQYPETVTVTGAK